MLIQVPNNIVNQVLYDLCIVHVLTTNILFHQNASPMCRLTTSLAYIRGSTLHNSLFCSMFCFCNCSSQTMEM